MSATTTPDGEAQSPENTTSEYEHLHGTAGVLSMNGSEIELSYSDVLDIRSALMRSAWSHRDEDRPASVRTQMSLREKLAPAVGRDE